MLHLLCKNLIGSLEEAEVDGISFAGILCNRYLSDWVQLVRPYVVFASLLDTCACIGASLSSNAVAARSILGLQLLIPVRNPSRYGVAFGRGWGVAVRKLAESVDDAGEDFWDRHWRGVGSCSQKAGGKCGRCWRGIFPLVWGNP
jgi:hypothetical protein